MKPPLCGAQLQGDRCGTNPVLVGLGVVLLVICQACLGAFCGHMWRRDRVVRALADAKEQNAELRAENAKLETLVRAALLDDLGQGPFEAVTGGAEAHQFPPMYGKVKEKTIWSYWYDPEDCPNSTQCELPTLARLSKLSVDVNSGTFKHRLLHRDDVDQYISGYELPAGWADLPVDQQRDTLMIALLARYGGVALDLSLVLLRPLDIPWEYMLRQEATFQGYMYRVNGQHWNQPESTATWFMMSRREGIFGAAVRSQIIAMGDLGPKYHGSSQRSLGDHLLTPVILGVFDGSLPQCVDDPTVKWQEGENGPTTDSCPKPSEACGPHPGARRECRTDARLILRDPRDGPQLPTVSSGMAQWSIADESPLPQDDESDSAGSPMYLAGCSSMKSCWEDVFLKRYKEQNLRLVRMHDGSPANVSAKDVLDSKESYLHNWLRLAGVFNDTRRLNKVLGLTGRHAISSPKLV